MEMAVQASRAAFGHLNASNYDGDSGRASKLKRKRAADGHDAVYSADTTNPTPKQWAVADDALKLMQGLRNTPLERTGSGIQV